MRVKLTQSLIRKTAPEKGKRVELWDAILPGLFVRIGEQVKTYCVRYQLPGGPKRKMKIGSADVLSISEARDFAREVLVAVSRGEDPAKKETPLQEFQLGQFLEEHYIPWVLKNRKAGKTTAGILRASFQMFWEAPLSDITRQSIEAWREDMRNKRKNKAASINRKYGALKAALNWGVEMELLPRNPLEEIKGLKSLKETDSEEKVRYLTPEEEECLYKALRGRDEELRRKRRSHNQWCELRGKNPWPSLDNVAFADHLEPMITISLKTGVRRGTLFRLEWRDVDFDHRMLTVRAEICKTGKSRKIPLNTTALETLQKWKEQQGGGGLVFSSPKTGGVIDNCNSSWATLLKTAGIKGFRWHDMRHTFASKLVMNGADLNVVRELLGHSDLKMTLRYAHLAPEARAQAVELLG